MTEQSKVEERVLILLTDGNDTASRIPPIEAAKIAAERHLVIHTIGIGDPRASGEDKVDLQALQRLADATHGRSFRGEDRAGLEEIYATLDRITPQKVRRTEYRPKISLFFYPLGAAAALLLIYHAIAMLSGALRNHDRAPSRDSA
jgi:Ca-activated chloride channel homolog